MTSDPRNSERDEAGCDAEVRPDASIGDAAGQPAVARGTVCLICGTAMYGVHCKLICPNCGYKEDCSDLFAS